MSIRKLTCNALFMVAFFTIADLSAQRIEVHIGGGRPRYSAPSRPPCPGPDYQWIEGRWVWDNYYRRDVWIEGYWRRMERDYYCDHDCHNGHQHSFRKQKRGRGNAYGHRENDRYSNRNRY